jgi:hypothetical protein
MLSTVQGSRGLKFVEPIIVSVRNDTVVDRVAGEVMHFDLMLTGRSTNHKEDSDLSAYFNTVDPSTTNDAQDYFPCCILKNDIAAGAIGLAYVQGTGIPAIADGTTGGVVGVRFGVGTGAAVQRLAMTPTVGQLTYGWAQEASSGAGAKIKIVFNGVPGVGNA